MFKRGESSLEPIRCIRIRLLAGFGILLTVILGMCVVSVWYLRTLPRETEMIHQHPFTVKSAVQRIEANMARMHRSMKDVVLADTPEEFREAQNRVDQCEQDIFEDLAIVRERYLGDPADVRRLTQEFRMWKPIREEVVELKREGKDDEAEAITKQEGARYLTMLEERAHGLTNFAEGKADAFLANSRRAERDAIVAVLTLSLGAVLLSVLVALHVTRNITRVGMDLTAARDSADAANRSKSAFVANMSHEVRTPMNVIVGMCSLALSTDLTAQQRNYIEKIERAAGMLLGIVNDILDFSKIEAGRLDMERIEFSIEEAVKNSICVCCVDTHDADVELLTDVSPDIPPTVLGDPLRVTQILNNILSNAIKFTHEGEVVLSVAVAKQHDDAVEIDFRVRDTGIGMTEEQKNSAFQVFSQADTNTTRKYGGSGLGLAITQRLVELMGGEVRIESFPGVGTSVSIRLSFPVVEQRTRDEDATRELTKLRGMHTLIVDDNATARDILRRLMQSMHFQVEVAASGLEALNIIRGRHGKSNHISLMLIDWRMPAMDGIQLAKRIKREESDDAPRLLMVTAADGSLIPKEEIENLIDGVVSKPVQPSTLLDVIQQVFGGGTVGRSDAKTISNEAHYERLRGRKVLLAEDLGLNQEIVEQMLGKYGVHVTVAENGQEAVDLVKRRDFDLVLMDVQMPVLDGLEATRIIRTLDRPGVKELPILAMTAHAMREHQESCREAGMNDHLVKPLDMKELLDALVRWMPAKTTAPPPTGDSNIEEARTRYGGGQDNEAYRKLVRRFLQDFGEIDRVIEGNFRQGDIEATMWDVHRIKGVAGLLGAPALTEKAQELLARQKEPEADLLEDMESFLEELRGVVERFHEVVEA